MLSEQQLERYWARVERHASGCWSWTGNNDGKYGYFDLTRTPRVKLGAHRVAFLIANGFLDEKLDVHHSCLNKLCVNPDHLSQVSRSDHLRIHMTHEHAKMVSASRKRSSACGNGHDFTVENTYVYQGRRQCRACRRAAIDRFRSRRKEVMLAC